MNRSLFACLCTLSLLLPATVHAQGTASGDDRRPATTTADGDTGLWYVPTAEVLARGKWSASVYRTGFNYAAGFSNVAEFPLTVGVGIAPRLEAFAAFKAISRIDRDLRPVFTSDPEVGGVIAGDPYQWKYWTGNKVGDLLVGLKASLLSESYGQPVAVAIRGIVKLPTGDRDAGVSTGKTDGYLDFVVSKDVAHAAEISGYVGGAFRGNPGDVSQSNGLRWGIGAGFPSHFPLRFTAELNGEKPFDDSIVISVPIVGIDNSVATGTRELPNLMNGTLGLTFQMTNGFFLGAAMTKSFSAKSRDGFLTDSDPFGDFVDFQLRLGFHPGVRRFVPPPPPPPTVPPTPPAPPPANRPPTFGGPGGQPPITATKDGQPCGPPCTLEPGQSITLTANAQDADGDTLTYRWTAPSGTFSTPNGRSTLWTAGAQEGNVPITVTVDDGKGGTATQTFNVNVARPRPAPIVQLNFEDVYFDFDRSSLRPEALRLLDDAISTLQANPTRSLIIEGHTCNIGTPEYNLALSERRARAVQNYLTSRGISESRLEIRTYGEEQPKYDNSREETRRLNRRAALVVKVQ
jgi:outer membrane protein OmpA-like peptidoglycan-associated protein